MNGLEALEIISKNKPRVCASCGYTSCKDCEKVLAKAQIEKELKALEIIKKSISDKTSLDLLLRQLLCYEKITEDEFYLLKEVLK